MSQNKTYNTTELMKLMRIRAIGESDYFDDIYTSDRQQFIDSVSKFIIWLDKMEKNDKR